MNKDNIIEKQYYQDQLDKLTAKSEFAPTLKIKSEGGDTHWLDINRDSANAIVVWLQNNFLLNNKY